MSKTVLAILFGGRSSEYEVSLASAYSVLTNADAEKYEILPVGITKEGAWLRWPGSYEAVRDGSWCADASSLERVTVDLTPGASALLLRAPSGAMRSVRVDAVFPVLHGAYGEDGTVQGMLALAGIPCVGCGAAAGAVAMDKALTKASVAPLGIRQARCVVLRRGETDAAALRAAASSLGYPVFLKPARAGSSVGVSKVHSEAQLDAAAAAAFREDEKILMEETIVGREIEVAVLEEHGVCTVSDCAEIDSGAEFYDYDAKYRTDTSRFYIPARLPESVRGDVRAAAERIFRALECRGLSRVDFFVTEENEVVFNEINTLPGFTSISMYPKLMMHAGLRYSELIDRLVAAAR